MLCNNPQCKALLHYFPNSLQRAKIELRLLRPFRSPVTIREIYLPVPKNLT